MESRKGQKMKNTKQPTYWEMLDTAHPEWVSGVVALANWSHSCDYPTPMTFFLDLIGYSEEHFGEKLCKGIPDHLDYLELDYLADAIKEYSARPLDVHSWVSLLMAKEQEL
jgi:hypothetical protein